jgi:hypothetical protein
MRKLKVSCCCNFPPSCTHPRPLRSRHTILSPARLPTSPAACCATSQRTATADNDPPLKTWPRCAPDRTSITSVRGMKGMDLSVTCTNGQVPQPHGSVPLDRCLTGAHQHARAPSSFPACTHILCHMSLMLGGTCPHLLDMLRVYGGIEAGPASATIKLCV